jgi:hypothetical protein
MGSDPASWHIPRIAGYSTGVVKCSTSEDFLLHFETRGARGHRSVYAQKPLSPALSSVGSLVL